MSASSSLRSIGVAPRLRGPWLAMSLTAVSGLAVAGAEAPPDAEDQIRHRRLTWDDFQGRSPRQRAELAQIVTAIETGPIEVKTTPLNKGYWQASPLALEFFAVMDRGASSVDKGARNSRLLAHEQGHFDLAEVMARHLGRRLAGVEAQGATAEEARANVVRRIEQAHAEAVAELSELHASYDRDTGHGTIKREQRRWGEEIARMLAETPPVAPTTE